MVAARPHGVIPRRTGAVELSGETGTRAGRWSREQLIGCRTDRVLPLGSCVVPPGVLTCINSNNNTGGDAGVKCSRLSGHVIMLRSG